MENRRNLNARAVRDKIEGDEQTKTVNKRKKIDVRYFSIAKLT